MMQLTTRPLTAAPMDADLFVDREDELTAILRSVALRFNTLVVGEPGSGKTSLVNAARRELEDVDRTVVTVDAAPYDALWDVLRGVSIERTGEPLDGLWTHEPAAPRARGQLTLDPAPVTERLVHRFAALFPDDALVVVDGMEPDTAFALFGRFRDTLWEHGLVWLVTSQLADRSTVLSPPADAFFPTVVELGPLATTHLRELLMRRAAGNESDDADRLRALAEQMGSSTRPLLPRTALVAAARMLVSGSGDAYASEVAQRERARAIGHQALRLFDTLQELRGAHAGDESLLERLGMSRPRAVQLLKELEADGLVDAHLEGRRKIYTVPAPG